MSKQEIWELFYGADTAIRGRNILAVLVAALIIGFVIFITYRVTHLSTAYSAKINATNVAITLITAVIMLMISSNIVISLGMVGALSIVRFRAAIKEPMEIVCLFWAVAAGIVIGAGMLPLAVIVAGWLLMRRYRPTVFTRVAAGLIVGGFLGNFGERLLFGSVVDMLYFPWLPWFICNVADIAICFGVAMLVISTLLRPQDWRERRENDSAAGGN